MADTFKVLAQLKPSSATATTLYTVPRREGTGVNSQYPAQTTISSLVVCNQNATTADTFRVRIKVKNAGDDSKQFIYYNKSVSGQDTLAAVIGITLSESDVIEVYATNGTLSFNLFGVETT
jgi:hypothetical protein|tara:strand:+ start:3475 stop:3837 length:363 start_codon:yes stop_codon:yes gene_type:complete